MRSPLPDRTRRFAGPAAQRRPVLVLFNPAARTAVAGALIASTIRETLCRHGLTFDVIETASEDDARQHAAAAARSGAFGTVVAAGGDGTVHAVAQGLLSGRTRADGQDGLGQDGLGAAAAHEPPALGILPLGTMNNVAHSLGIPEALDDACAVLAHANARPMDIGTVSGHIFVEVAGLGLEARLAPWGDSVKGNLLRRPAIALRMVGLLRRSRPARVALEANGHRIHLRALQVTVCNAPRYGISFTAAPDARMDDGWLDVVIYSGAGLWALTIHYLRMLSRRRGAAPGVHRMRVQRLRIAPEGAPWPIHVDGVCIGETPATIEVLPAALHVIAPSANHSGSEGASLTPAEALFRATAAPATTVAAQAALAAANRTSGSLSSSAEGMRQALEARSDEARAAVGVEPPRRSARRARALRLVYLAGLAGSLALTYAVRRANLLPGDLRLTRALQRRRSPLADRFWSTVAAPGFPEYSTPLVAVAAVGFLALRLRTEAIFMLLASGTNAANWAIKRLVRRERPTAQHVRVAKVINEPGFPSGHVMHYLSFYGFLAAAALANLRPSRLRRAIVGVCLAMIGLVGPSRVYLGAHWPSDVAAGYLYGGLYLGGLLEVYARVKQRQSRP